jgi:hypothetical protein
MKHLSQLTDPVFVKPTQETILDRLFKGWIRDERDLPFIYLTCKITLTLWPLAIIMYWPGVNNWVWWGAAIAYQFLNNLTFKGPFGLMLHCTSHRVLFEKKYQFWNNYLPWAIGPLFGQTPESYYSHHIGMHHPENNMPDDDSSTMMYQRDSVKGFLHYLWSFVTFGVYDTARYHLRKKRNKLCVRLLRGELVFIAACIGLSFINFPATFVVFILPFLISRVIGRNMLLSAQTNLKTPIRTVSPASIQNTTTNAGMMAIISVIMLNPICTGQIIRYISVKHWMNISPMMPLCLTASTSCMYGPTSWANAMICSQKIL